MVGIISYGVHIPMPRLPRAVIAEHWGARGLPGERAVANYDEDSLTMAVAAARDCLKKAGEVSVDAVYFATTTAPYKEKQSAALIAAVLSCAPETQTLDFGNSLRAGTSAVSAAVNAVAAGTLETVLVLASDLRPAYPKSPQEMSFGDGAVAMLIGKMNLIAEVEHFYTHFDEIQDVWRSDKDTFVRNAEARFAQEYGYGRVVRNAVAGALADFDLKPEDFSSICTNFANPKQAMGIFARLGFAADKQLRNHLHGCVGDTGTSMSLLYLASVLEQAEHGAADQRILVANYSNGCDVLCVKTTEALGDIAAHASFAKQLENKIPLSSYSKYLTWREFIEVQPAARPPVSERQPTPSAQFREVKGELALNGTKCNVCGTPQYPPQRVCMICKTKDQFTPYNFSNLKGKVSSFSHDHMMETLDAPVTLTVVDFDGGGRIMCDMTDRDPDKTVVGMAVEMTFRKLYYVGGIYNYWWKCKPTA